MADYDFKNKYFPGKLVVLANEFFNKQKRLSEENNITQWTSFVERYFSTNCIYSIIMNRDNRTWTFNSGYKTLPQVFKSKFEEKLSMIGAYLENPEEYLQSDGKYLLIVHNFTLMEKYKDNFVSTQGILRILFDQNFKMHIFEFLSKEHQEYPTKDPNHSVVNEFGITPQFSRTLIICEALTDMMENINQFCQNINN